VTRQLQGVNATKHCMFEKMRFQAKTMQSSIAMASSLERWEEQFEPGRLIERPDISGRTYQPQMMTVTRSWRPHKPDHDACSCPEFLVAEALICSRSVLAMMLRLVE
jgi:hypothetical protein